MPAQVGSIPLDDAELMVARLAAVEPVLWMIDQAPADGILRSDVAFGDIGLVLMRLSRPFTQEFSRDLDSSLAHRYLALVVAGLRGVSNPSRLRRSPIQSRIAATTGGPYSSPLVCWYSLATQERQTSSKATETCSVR